MYDKAFEENIQIKMRDYFLKLAEKGRKVHVSRKQEIKINYKTEFGVVLSGKVGEAFISKNGIQKELYFLIPGEVFGDLNYLEDYEQDTYVYAIEDSEIAIIPGKYIEESVRENPEKFRFIYHSLFRKYQVAKFQLINLVCTDAFTNVCDTLVRVSMESGNRVISSTHQHLSELIGCNRITVTKALKFLKEKGIIELGSGTIKIKDMEELKKQTDKY